MPNITPYELRFNVLTMARDLEMQQYETLMSMFWSLSDELAKKISEIGTFPDQSSWAAAEELRKISDSLIKAVPPMPTSAQINQRAKELYEFVENK